MQKNRLGGLGSDPDPAGRTYSAPPDLLADGEGAGYFLPKNPTLALGLSGLACLHPLIFQAPELKS